jgi:hypothetical protein
LRRDRSNAVPHWARRFGTTVPANGESLIKILCFLLDTHLCEIYAHNQIPLLFSIPRGDAAKTSSALSAHCRSGFGLIERLIVRALPPSRANEQKKVLTIFKKTVRSRVVRQNIEKGLLTIRALPVRTGSFPPLRTV